MANIAITALNTFDNRGVEALGVSIVNGLRSTITDCDISVVTRDLRGADRVFAGSNVSIVPDSAWSPKVNASAVSKATFRARRALRTAIGRTTASEKTLASADLVVVSGGDVFSSDYDIMERYLRQLDQVAHKGTPIFFLAQSIGPFATDAELRSFRSIARFATFSVRERLSRTYLLDVVGLPSSRVILTADPAFALAVDPARRDALFKIYGLQAGEYAALAVSRGISSFSKIDHSQHIRAWVEAVRTLVQQGVRRFAFIPHVQLPSREHDDLALATDIVAAIRDDASCVVVDGDHSASDFKAILSGAAFAIAERTHGAIGAMSQGVPTLSVGYSVKARGVLEELIDSPALLQAALVSAPEFSDLARTASIVRQAWSTRGQFADALRKSLPQARERAAYNYEIARSLVNARAPAQ